METSPGAGRLTDDGEGGGLRKGRENPAARFLQGGGEGQSAPHITGAHHHDLLLAEMAGEQAGQTLMGGSVGDKEDGIRLPKGLGRVGGRRRGKSARMDQLAGAADGRILLERTNTISIFRHIV